MIGNSSNIELLCVIVNLGLGSKVKKVAKQNGVSGCTILLGRGTINNKLLDFLCLSDVRKEVVMMIANSESIDKVSAKLYEEFKFNKPNHGIAYTTTICDVLGSRSCKCNNFEDKQNVDKEVENSMYHVITVILDKGRAEDAIDAATKAGSQGGTILNARGSGVHETSKVFAMEIEPEKEVIIILSKNDKTDQIVTSIRKELKLDEPGNGIIYVQDINKTYGLYEK